MYLCTKRSSQRWRRRFLHMTREHKLRTENYEKNGKKEESLYGHLERKYFTLVVRRKEERADRL